MGKCSLQPLVCYNIFCHYTLFMLLVEMANGPDDIWHNTGTYNTTRHEHVLVGHTARHSTHVGWPRLRILGTWALKAQYDQRQVKHNTMKKSTISTFYFLMKANLKFYNFTNNLKLNFLNSFNSQFQKNTIIDLYL